MTADLTASPASGFYRTEHTFTGSGFAPNETVRIYVSGVGSAVLATATTDASGSFTVPAREPATPFGPRVYVGVGASSHKLGAASFTATPNLVFNPDSGPPGGSVTAEGYGFPPFRQVEIYWGSPRTLVGTAIADVNGTVSGSAALTFTVPTGAAAGDNTILGTWVCSTWPSTCPSDSGFGYRFDPTPRIAVSCGLRISCKDQSVSRWPIIFPRSSAYGKTKSAPSTTGRISLACVTRSAPYGAPSLRKTPRRLPNCCPRPSPSSTAPPRAASSRRTPRHGINPSCTCA